MIEDLRRKKEILHLSQPIVESYNCFHLSESCDARRLLKAVAAGPRLRPPVREKTSGVNDECSTSRIRCS